MRIITNINDLKQILLKLERFKLSDVEGRLILDYLEGHDYEIKTNDKELLIVDIHNEIDICKETLLDIIYRVQTWNMELIEDTESEIDKLYSTLDDHEEFAKLMSYLLKLKNDEKKIDELISILDKKIKVL